MAITRYVKYNNEIRAHIKYDKKLDIYRITVQKLYWFLWVYTYFDVEISEGFWGEQAYIGNPMILSCTDGTSSEHYKTGTIDLKSRAVKLCQDFCNKELKQKTKSMEFSEMKL